MGLSVHFPKLCPEEGEDKGEEEGESDVVSELLSRHGGYLEVCKLL